MDARLRRSVIPKRRCDVTTRTPLLESQRKQIGRRAHSIMIHERAGRADGIHWRLTPSRGFEPRHPTRHPDRIMDLLTFRAPLLPRLTSSNPGSMNNVTRGPISL